VTKACATESSASDFRRDLELFAEMIELMAASDQARAAVA
jgi:hypothetical protein